MDIEVGQIWSQTLNEFLETDEKDGKTINRFNLVEE